jgi:hypothetical protein
MFRARTLPALLCASTCTWATACFNPPDTPLTGETTVTPADDSTTAATTGIDPDTSVSSSVGPTTEVDPETTITPPESTSTDTGETTMSGGDPEIEVTIDGMVIASGDGLDLDDTVAVDAQGPEVGITIENTGSGNLLIGGVLAMGPDASQVTIDQAALAASIAPGESSSFTATFAPTNGGAKQILLSIGNNDADESPFELTLRGHTTENAYRQIMTMGPSPRFNATLEDLRDGRLLLFGGRNAAGTWLDDTWVFELDTGTWTELDPPTSPPARNAHGMALVEPGTVVMYGGTATAGAGGGFGDTWAFDVAAEDWDQLNPPLSPPARFQHEMVSIGDGRALVFGGRSPGGLDLADTWAFDVDTGNWANLAPPGGPSPVQAYALAFDGNDTVTRYGGFQNQAPIDQTWNYTISTNSWSMMAPVATPGPRAVLSGEYLGTGQMVVFSGKLGDCCVNPTGGTFAYDPPTNTWITITPPMEPPPRFNYAMAPVLGANKAILFGGLTLNGGSASAIGQTWEYVGFRP